MMVTFERVLLALGGSIMASRLRPSAACTQISTASKMSRGILYLSVTPWSVRNPRPPSEPEEKYVRTSMSSDEACTG